MGADRAAFARRQTHAQTESDAAGAVEWDVNVEGTVARAHQHAATQAIET